MLDFLKSINNFPLPITAKHYSPLGQMSSVLKDGKLGSKESWQVMRDLHPDYRIASTREDWLKDLALKKDGQDKNLLERVSLLSDFIRLKGFKKFYSVGSGGGVFEYYLKKQIPELKIFLSEPTEAGVERLKKVFLEAERIEIFDALDISNWQRLGRDKEMLVFIYRNEREFSNSDWRKIFSFMYEEGVENVFLGLMSTLTLLSLFKERIRNLKLRIKGLPPIFVGYIRNFSAFKSFWSSKYMYETVPFVDCKGVYLKKI